MYLTELYRFYERMTQDPQSGMPPEGMSAEAIHFALVIGEDGSLKGVHDLRDSKGKPLRRFVPAAVSRSSNVAANFLWDKTSYVLGIDGRDDSCPSPEKRQAFLALHHERFDACPDRHAKALLAFLDHWRPEMCSTACPNVRPCWVAAWSSSLKAKTASSTKNRPWTQARQRAARRSPLPWSSLKTAA